MRWLSTLYAPSVRISTVLSAVCRRASLVRAPLPASMELIFVGAGFAFCTTIISHDEAHVANDS